MAGTITVQQMAESIGTDVEQEEVRSEEIPEAASDEPPLTPAELRAGLTPEQAEAFERIAAEAVSRSERAHV